MFIHRGAIGKCSSGGRVAKAVDKCTVFPKEEMRREQDGEEGVMIQR